MGEQEDAINKLAETLLKAGLASNWTMALERAKASFGAEEILKKVQSSGKDPILKENKTVNDLLKEVSEESPEETQSSPKPVLKTETQEPVNPTNIEENSEKIEISEFEDLDEEEEKISEEE